MSVLVFTMAVIPGAIHEAATFDAEEDVSTGKLVDPDTGRTTEFRVSSEVSSWGKNVNRLAFLCNASILLIWMFAQIWRHPAVRIVGFLVMLVLAALTLGTASRSGFLSLGLVFVFLLLQRGIPKSLRVGVVGAMVFCALIFFLVLPRAAYERLLNYNIDQSAHDEAWRSTQSRIETNEHALETFRRAPLLGVGPGNFRWYHRENWPYSLAAGRPNHNSYLWAATEGGLVTLGLYLVLFAIIWRDLQAAQRRYPQGHTLWHVARFLRGLMGLFIFFSAFADFWLEPHLYLLAGCSMLLARRTLIEPEVEPEAEPEPSLREARGLPA
jgi:O-antigen ligase